RDGNVKVWNAGNGRLIGALEKQAGSITGLAFLGRPNKTAPRLAVATRGENNKGDVKIWALTNGEKGALTGKEEPLLKEGGKGATCLAVSSDLAMVAAGSADGAITVWGVESGEVLSRIKSEQTAVRAIAFGLDSSLLVSGGSDGSLRFWNPNTGTETRPVQK